MACSCWLIGPDPACIVNQLGAAFSERDRFEGIMIDQWDQDFAIEQRAVDVGQCSATAVKFIGQRGCIGLDHMYPIAEFMRKCRRDLLRGTFAEIVNIGLEGQS